MNTHEVTVVPYGIYLIQQFAETFPNLTIALVVGLALGLVWMVVKDWFKKS